MEKRGLRRKTHISWLLKDLESHNWYQMIAKTTFYSDVIRYVKHQLFLLDGY